jgi:hypothetical protein
MILLDIQHPAPPSALAGQAGRGDKGDARDQVANAVGVSGRTIDHATNVLNRAVPELIQVVDEGRMAVVLPIFIETILTLSASLLA